MNATEGARDVFENTLSVTAKTSGVVNLEHVQCYLVAEVTLYFGHSDGTRTKQHLPRFLRKYRMSVHRHHKSYNCGHSD